MQAEEVIERFKRTGALLEGHFILSSGLHSASYLQCALVLQHPAEAAAFGRALAERYGGVQVETVAAGERPEPVHAPNVRHVILRRVLPKSDAD